MNKGIKTNKSFVDNSKVSDHHAIIPTEESVTLANLSNDERKVYDLVIKRFLSVLLPPCEYKQTTIEAVISEEKFVAKGKQITSKGWTMVYDKEDFENEEEHDEQE